MKKHLHYYTQHSQYVEPTDKPAVSYCELEDEVHYSNVIPCPPYPNPGLTEISEIKEFMEAWYTCLGLPEKAECIHNSNLYISQGGNGKFYSCYYPVTGKDITYTEFTGEIEEVYS